MTRAPRRCASATRSAGDAWSGGAAAAGSQRLRSHPVLAIRAVQIAPEHSEAVGQRAWMCVKERLLLNRITLNAANVAPRDHQAAVAVIADLADTNRAFRQRTAVAAGITPQPTVGKHIVEVAFAGFARQDISEGRHRRLISLYPSRPVSAPWHGWEPDAVISNRA